MTAPRLNSQQAVRDGVDDRRTPDALWRPLNVEHRFTLDAAASPANAKCARYFTRDSDGLLRSWAGERVWCNPPYSRLEPWVAKAWAEMRGGCELVVMLIPANRTEQPFWQQFVEPFRDGQPRDGIALTVRFLPGRIRFLAPGQIKTGSPQFGCVLLTWTRAGTLLPDPANV